MPFQIIRNDITRVSADAIVNTANPQPAVGGGTDRAIYQAAGEKELLAERKKIGEITPGNAAETPAFRLKAKYIIHTVGPAWIDGNHGERETLHNCYANSLALAAELHCESIAFPLIATGVYGFPKDEALDIALKEIGKFLLTHEMDITLVVFDRSALQLSKVLLGSIDEYIDEHAVGLLRAMEYGGKSANLRRRIAGERPLFPMKSCEIAPEPLPGKRPIPKQEPEEKEFRKFDRITDDELIIDSLSILSMEQALPDMELDDWDLDELLTKQEDTFQQRLFRLIDERGLKDPEVYNKANISRKVFSKIRCNKNYRPKKVTAVALAIALHLDMPTMIDLLSRAEIAFSPSSKFDLIIAYFVDHQIYDIYKINAALFKYDQELLGV